MLTTLAWIPWNLLHSTVMKYLACQAWILTQCTVFGEYLSAIWIPEFEFGQRQSCSHCHICCSLFVIYCSLFFCLGCFRHLFGQQEKKKKSVGLDHKSYAMDNGSQQSKGTVWNSSGGLKCVHQNFTFITEYNRNICLPVLHK